MGGSGGVKSHQSSQSAYFNKGLIQYFPPTVSNSTSSGAVKPPVLPDNSTPQREDNTLAIILLLFIQKAVIQ